MANTKKVTETALHIIGYLFGKIAIRLFADDLIFYISNAPILYKIFPYINIESGAEGLSFNQHLQTILKEINAQEPELTHSHQGVTSELNMQVISGNLIKWLWLFNKLGIEELWYPLILINISCWCYKKKNILQVYLLGLKLFLFSERVFVISKEILHTFPKMAWAGSDWNDSWCKQRQ